MAVSSRPALDRDLLRLLGDLLRLGSQVDQQLERAIKALRSLEIQLARQVAEVDERLDQLRYQLEQECVSTIAMQQPAATDLRRIIAIAHMTVELDRMAKPARSGIARHLGPRPGEPPACANRTAGVVKMLVHVVEARHVAAHTLWLRFDDGVEGEIDLSAEIHGEVFEPLKEVE